jgi:nucleoside-diphosphate-sugar epimerase
MAAQRLLDADQPLLESFFVSGRRMSVRDLTAEVAAAVGRPIRARFGERPYRPREVMDPVQPGPDGLLPGWRARCDLHESIRQMAGAPGSRFEDSPGR